MIAAVAGGAAGACFGGAQWLVLRHHAQHAQQWIWIHIPAWALAMAAIFLGATVPTAEWPAWGIALCGAAGGSLGGMLLGAVSGVVVRDLEPWVDERHWSLKGKVCAVTGANAGLGYEIALGLARFGAAVVLLCRRESEGESARRAIVGAQPDADVRQVPCDLANLSSVHAAGAQLLHDYSRLDVLVHNAGATFPQREMTRDGIEATLAVDVVGPFVLTELLRERLDACHARVIMLTGICHRRGCVDLHDLHFDHRPYDWLVANNQAQRGRLLFMSELARRAPALTTASVHPGAVWRRVHTSATSRWDAPTSFVPRS